MLVKESKTHDVLKSIEKIILEYCGFKLANSRRAILHKIILHRSSKMALNDISKYYHRLVKDVGNGVLTELNYLVEAITVNETFFFRDVSQYQFLRSILLSLKNKKSISLLSLGTSTGEEAYSIAMTVCDVLGDRDNCNFNVAAIDINQKSLDTAKQGKYLNMGRRIKNIPSHYFDKYLIKGNDYYLISNQIKRLIVFTKCNIVKETILGNYDIIFMKNILMYFTTHSKRIALENMDKVLKAGGYLFLGTTEILDDKIAANYSKLHYNDIVIYKKNAVIKPKTVAITEQDVDIITTVFLKGIIDKEENPSEFEVFLDTLHRLLPNNFRDVILDMSYAEYISLEGLRKIIDLGKQLRKTGRELVLVVTKRSLKQLMIRNGINNIFHIFDSMKESKRFLRHEQNKDVR